MIIQINTRDKKRFPTHAKIFLFIQMMQLNSHGIPTIRHLCAQVEPSTDVAYNLGFLGILHDPSVSRRFNKCFLCILYSIIVFSILWWVTKAELQGFWTETIKDRISFSLRCFRAIFLTCYVQFNFLILIPLQHTTFATH